MIGGTFRRTRIARSSQIGTQPRGGADEKEVMHMRRGNKKDRVTTRRLSTVTAASVALIALAKLVGDVMILIHH